MVFQLAASRHDKHKMINRVPGIKMGICDSALDRSSPRSAPKHTSQMVISRERSCFQHVISGAEQLSTQLWHFRAPLSYQILPGPVSSKGSYTGGGESSGSVMQQ